MAAGSVWGWLVGLLLPTERERRDRLDERIRALDAAVRRHPESAAACVSRGEALLDVGMLDAASADFRQALALAEAQFKTDTWGVVAQAVRDRALRGLEQSHGRS
jgi:predicted Zn-dependent protease